MHWENFIDQYYMNTGQRNTHGRTIYRGPRGGEYVLGPGGRKIRSFTRATAAPAAAVPAGNRNILGRVIHRGPRGGEYVLGAGGRKIRKFTRATAAPVAAPVPAPAPAVPTAFARRLAGMLKLGNNEYINTNGRVHNGQGFLKMTSTYVTNNNARTRAFNKNPMFLKKYTIPYVGPNRPNMNLTRRLRLKNSTINHEGKNYRRQLTGVKKRVYYDPRNGELYFISLNGRKHRVNNVETNPQFMIMNAKNVRRYKRLAGLADPQYPRHAIPPATPEARRSSPELLNNMITQIFTGGRGANINAGRYTMAERNVLARRLENSIRRFKQLRDSKRLEASRRRASLRAPGISNMMKQQLRNQAAAANERTMYYNNAVRSYTRGLRAVKPLSGAVTPRARRMPATPNRPTPAPANVEENAIYMPLNRPHLVVKTPGVGTIYLNPNTFRGLVRNSARVNIAPANVRDWLRMARRNFPNEVLFRHPLAPRNVTANHIRFSRA